MSQTQRFTTSDGFELVGDLALPDAPCGAAIVCHPHPQYGGNRHNHVVQALFDALPASGIAALRFDFRSDFDGGQGETLDALAAIDHLAASIPADVPIFATGYSFGAAIALRVADPRLTANVLVAPPLAAMPTVRAMDIPTLVLTPANDQFSPPDATAPIVAEWPNTEHVTIESADHFLAGPTATPSVADATVTFLTRFCS